MSNPTYQEIFENLTVLNTTGTYIVNDDGPPEGDSGDTLTAPVNSVYFDGLLARRELVSVYRKVFDAGDASDWVLITTQPYLAVATYNWEPPPPEGSAGEWGGIGGILANQTDLMTVLNGKASTTHNHNGVYQPLDSDLTQIADGVTQPGKNLIFDETVEDQRNTLGLGSLATKSAVNNSDWSGQDLGVPNGGTGASDAAGARSNLGVEIGTDVQAYSGQLTAFGNIATNGFVARTGLDTGAARTLTGSTGRIAVTNGDGVNGDPTFDLAVTTVTPGSYNQADITVDEYGRITSAADGTVTLDDLSDVDAGDPQEGDFLRYMGSPLGWRAVNTISDSHLIGDGLRVVGSPETLELDDTVLRTFSSIDELVDVVVGSPLEVGHVLAFFGSPAVWTNVDPSELGLGGGGGGGGVSFIAGDGLEFVNSPQELQVDSTVLRTTDSINDLVDVDLATPSANHFLVYMGSPSEWQNRSASQARTHLGLGSLATASTVNNGDWSGTDLSVANGGTGGSDAATARSNLGVATFDIMFPLDTGSDNTWYVDFDAGFAYTIVSANAVCSSGTITAAIEIEGTPVTGLDAIAISSTPNSNTASAANSVVAGDDVTIVFTSNSTAVDIMVKLHCTRA